MASLVSELYYYRLLKENPCAIFVLSLPQKVQWERAQEFIAMTSIDLAVLVLCNRKV